MKLHWQLVHVSYENKKILLPNAHTCTERHSLFQGQVKPPIFRHPVNCGNCTRDAEATDYMYLCMHMQPQTIANLITSTLLIISRIGLCVHVLKRNLHIRATGILTHNLLKDKVNEHDEGNN